MSEADKKYVGVRVEPETWRRIKVEAAAQGIHAGDLIARMYEHYVESGKARIKSEI